jgi:formylglycine-generating enzyme required for sulfatase activity
MRYLATPFALDHRYADGQTAPAGTGLLQPNAWGLFDMHGNVQEWTASAYAGPAGAEPARDTPDAAGAQASRNANPATVDARRVVRGGSWMDRPHEARCAIRRGYHPWQRVHNVGFRIVVEKPRRTAATDR